VGALTQITVRFSEPVNGVAFSDLLVNGIPATGLSGGGVNLRVRGRSAALRSGANLLGPRRSDHGFWFAAQSVQLNWTGR